MNAVISPCGRYRYMLTRRTRLDGASRATIVFCMLNPSTADASLDDPTIRRCCGFAERWNSAGIAVVNLYAFRATDPRSMRAEADAIGPANDEWLRRAARDAGNIVCAWGANADPGRAQQVAKMFRQAGAKLWCFGTTKGGAPRHPLYIRGDQPLVEWGGYA